MNNNVLVRRIIAWIIDWNLSGLPCMLFLALNPDFAHYPTLQNTGVALLFVLLVFLYPVLFVFRDVIFNGRSVGKRIFGLYVLEKTRMNLHLLNKELLEACFSLFIPLMVLFCLLPKNR